MICSNNTMIVITLGKIRQSNRCESVKNYSTYSWDLVWALGSASSASCNTPATSTDSISPNNQPRRNKKSPKKIKLPANCISLPWPTYTEPRANRDRLGTQQQKAIYIMQPELTNENTGLREVHNH